MKHSSIVSLAAIAAATFAAGAAHAQSAGTWMVRAGATQIVPQVSSGDLSAPSLAATKVGVGPTSRAGGGVTYMVTDHIAVDVPLNAPYKHEIVGAGAIAGAGKLGDVKSAPATVLAQWRFLAPDALLRPYVGAGITYAKFYKARTTAVLSGLTGGSPSNPTLLHVDSKFAPTVQAGVNYAIGPRWFIDAGIAKTILKTTSHLSTGQSIETRLNPTSMTLGVGYKF